MKKQLVCESLQDFQIDRGELNEAIFSKITGAIGKFFQKIGKLFFFMFQGEPTTEANAPVNIGIMDKEGSLFKGISYVPSPADIEINPDLRSLTSERLIQKRGGDQIEESLMEELLLTEAGSRIKLEHPDKNVPNVDKKELYRRIRMVLKNPQAKPIMIWGAPGIGKTAIVKAVLSANTKGRLIDVQTSKMAPDDWSLPATYKVDDELKARDIPKSWLPVYIRTQDPDENKRRDEISNMGEGGILFLDELSRASGSVQNTCLKLIDERIIGDAVLGSKWSIISASNRAGDDPEGVQNFSTALGNRFSQINYIPDFKGWKEWAQDKVDPRILDFLEFNEEYFYTLEDDPEKSIFASPRSWEAASKNIALLMQDAKDEGYKVTIKDIVNVVGSDVGMDIATEFQTFLRLLESFKKEDIKEVLTHPDKARMPKKAGSGYDQSEANALISLVCTSTRGRDITPEEFNNFVTYLIRLDNGSLATRGLKMMIDIHPYIHEELGEVEGRDKYKEGVDRFIEKYKDIF
jgi:MoxR-like ATPase